MTWTRAGTACGTRSIRVRLDTPGTYYLADGGTEPFTEVVEADDNLVVLPAQ